MKNKKIGKMISRLRKEKKLTQRELASKLDVSDKEISSWERGVSVPTDEELLKLSKIFEEEFRIKNKGKHKLINLICNLVAMIMGCVVIILHLLNKLNSTLSIIMLGIGLLCLSISSIIKNKDSR